MKVTKVNRIRSAVSGKKTSEEGRGILYPTPNAKNSVVSVEEQIENRVENANNLYNLFFKSDIPYKLEGHFCRIVELAAKSKDVEVFIEKAREYKGYNRQGRNGNTYTEKIEWFNYGSSRKNINKTMETHVRERMKDIWQKEEYRYAAVAVLRCICDKKYNEKIKAVDSEVLKNFFKASKKCTMPYIDKNTDNLEVVFTVIMRKMAEERNESIEQRINWMKDELESVTLNEGKKYEKKILLNKLKFEYATEDRMKAVLVRMRKSLKRGTNGEVAVMLLQGLAQMNDKNLSMVLGEMQNSPKQKEALEKFLKAVEEDFYKTGIIKSIKNHDVKVQVHDARLDLSSLNIEKVSEKKKYKAALTKTLELYAASKESSDQVLKDIKDILLEYFMWEDSEVRMEFVTDEKLWNIPKREEEYFDQNFVPIDNKKNEKAESHEKLYMLWSRKWVKNIEIKNRINYVNCGKYQQMMYKKPDEFRKYWITFAKDYVEKNYVKKKRKLTQKDCYSTAMFLECWKDVIRFLCGKYIDIGKAVYHFAMPEEMSSKKHLEYGVLHADYQDGISSFEYEAIKAEENIQRDIANATVAAASAFSRSVMDVEKQARVDGAEDVMFLKEHELPKYMKEKDVVRKHLLRFYGGCSTIEGGDNFDGILLAKELLSHLKAIRNENFHFTNGKKVQLFTKYTEKLWESERKVYQQVIREKYYFNNVAMFYSEESLKKLVADLYKQSVFGEAQIPAFRNVWKRKDLPEDVKELSFSWKEKDDKHVVFLGALYFLLKEIYYRDFVVSEDIGRLFFKAVKEYAFEIQEDSKTNPKDTEKKNLANAGRNFKFYVDTLEERYNKRELTFGNVCQFINGEYNQQNSNQQEKEIYKHFKMLLPICVKRAFQEYVNEKYKFINKPLDLTNVTVTYLDDIEIKCMEIDKNQAHWFTFAHFIHPKQLNFLIGNFKDYIQYKQDVIRRAGYAGQLNNEKERKLKREAVNKCVEKAQNILNVLEFVRHVSGRISQEFSDYYENEEEYAKYMSAYIDFEVKDENKVFESLKYFCQNTLPEGENVDIYADAVKPKLLRNVEIARMYAGGDLVLPGYKKISKEEILEYYKNKDIVAETQAGGICQSQEDQKQIVDFQKLKARITLNEVTDLFSMVNDLLGELVSLVYLRERDQMYLFLGFYYMALRNADEWKDEVLDQVESGKYAVDKGAVLYQIIGVFDFGTKLLYWDKKENVWSDETGKKWIKFITNHVETYHCIIRLFGVEKYIEELNELRNYVDHSKYYVKYDKSILELYSQFYTKFFGYSSKLRKSVLFNLESTLEKYFVDSKLKFDGKENVLFDKETKSLEFTYKYEEQDSETDRKITKTLQLPAKSQTFMEEMYMLLQYKK